MQKIAHICASSPVIVVLKILKSCLKKCQLQAKGTRSCVAVAYSVVFRLNDKLVVKRVVVGDIVFVHSLTPCGYTVAAVHESVEHTVDWGKETCGLAELCIKCCDITTYCHFSDIGRRAINEPKWLNIFEKEDDFKERMDEFRHVVRQKSSISDIVATTLASACS